MGLPLDIFIKDPDKHFILNYAPLFSKLSDFEKILIIQKSKVVEYKKGDAVYRQGDPPGAFYCVISGRIRIFAMRLPSEGSVSAEKEALEYLNCGKYFGMISVLTGENHSVYAEAANDTRILEITQEDFKFILNKIPKLAIDLSQTLSRRLKKKDFAEKKIFESNIISVFSAGPMVGKTLYVINLGLSLKKETGRNVILINVTKIPVSSMYQDSGLTAKALDGSLRAPPAIKLDAPLPPDEIIKDAIFHDPLSGAAIVNVIHESADASYAGRLNAFLTYLTGSYHYIIVDLPDLMDDAIFSTLNQSDTIHVITNYERDNLRRAGALLSDLLTKVKYPQGKTKIILNKQEESEKLSAEDVVRILEYPVYAVLPFLEEQYRKAEGYPRRIVWEFPQLEYSRSIRRIARELGNIRVGLALGGGAAFGLAHIGIIKVLERENIPIDAIAGTSMGALIGALWASGLSAPMMEEIFLEYDNNRKKTYGLLLDLYLHKMSIAKGNKIRRFLARHIGDKTFQDVRIPLRVVACNITKRKEVVYSSGRLIDAIMPSIAIPGVFAPAVEDGDLIIDGGIIEPVPVGTLVRQGITKIIAVNVLPSPEAAQRSYAFSRKRKEAERESANAGGFVSRTRYRLFDRVSRMFSPNILDIIVNSIQAMEYAIAESDCQKSDILLSPIAEGVDWFDFFRVGTLIKNGEEEAGRMLPAIKSVLSE